LDACNNFNLGGPSSVYYTIGSPVIGTTIYVDTFTTVPLLGVNAVTLSGNSWGVNPVNGQINIPYINC
jgi:hypothetical protein